jgi:hypothetical protein
MVRAFVARPLWNTALDSLFHLLAMAIGVSGTEAFERRNWSLLNEEGSRL